VFVPNLKRETPLAPMTPQDNSRRKTWLSTVMTSTVLLLALGCAAVAVSAAVAKLPGEEKIASGTKRNTSVYVTMSDGTLIAVDIWFPAQMKAGEKLPAITNTTRYWRAQHVGWLGRALYGFGINRESQTIDPDIAYMNARGFIMLMVDARGTGASGGDRPIEWGPLEARDLGEVARWASEQPWSNGNLGAMGVSYGGNTAELAASTGEPAIRAVAPLYNDFDPQFHNSNPGGAFNTGFISVWGNATLAMDKNDICALAETPGLMCIFTKWMVEGVKRVDGDRSGAQLRQILATRNSNNVLNGLKGVEYRGDVYKDSGGLSLGDVAPFAKKEAVEKNQVPMMIWSSWVDAATTDGTLARYLTFKSPQIVHIGAYSHGGDHDGDPTAPTDQAPSPTVDVQRKMIADFFDTYLRGAPAPAPKSSIQYFTMGSRQWQQTDVWPPAGMTKRALYFGENGGLLDTQTGAGTDSYRVDFTASTGEPTRWATQMGGSDVVYPDRRDADTKLLTYTSAPVATPTIITGTPIVTAYLSTDATDGIVVAYLEDVAPDGRVTYITEGVLRLSNRQETTKDLPYAALGVSRNFRRADAQAVVPGDVMQVRIPLYATSMQIKAGHKIRIALAGAAQGQFDRLPQDQTPTWTLFRDAKHPSSLELPIER
jgi:uncharacterized protein